MRKTRKQDRVNTTSECSHSGDRTRNAVRGQRTAKGGTSSDGHGNTGEDVSRSKSEYMKAYYAANKSKWKRNREQQDKANESKRRMYREREEVREYYKSHAKQHRLKNPHQRRRSEVFKRYGLSSIDYDGLLEAQGNSCAVCGVVFTKSPHVDHCHDNGHVRGLLCFNCNRAIGHFQNDVQIMERAIKYLTRN